MISTPGVWGPAPVANCVAVPHHTHGTGQLVVRHTWKRAVFATMWGIVHNPQFGHMPLVHITAREKISTQHENCMDGVWVTLHMQGPSHCPHGLPATAAAPTPTPLQLLAPWVACGPPCKSRQGPSQPPPPQPLAPPSILCSGQTVCV